MRKFKMFVDVNKEEEWLNSMSLNGFECVNVSQFGVYTFINNDETQQTIRIDSQKFKTKEQHELYVELYEEYGWHHIAGSRWTTFQYWKKAASDDDALFSDRDSKKAFYRRLLDYYGSLTFIFMIFAITMMNGNLSPFNLREAYFTPGLWDKTGSDFILSLLFETPFAFMRFSIPWFMLIFAGAFAFVYYKYQQQVKKMDD